jgi:hypothetical protein
LHSNRHDILATAALRPSTNNPSTTPPNPPDACHHVLSLRVDEELSVKLVGAVGRVAREEHARAAVVVHIAVHHGLHVDCRALEAGDLVDLPVLDSTGDVPGPAADNESGEKTAI